MYSTKPCIVLGFHACDEEVGRTVVNRRDDLRISDKEYNWLGDGVYFWENNYERAKQYAELDSRRANSKIIKPFVIGAIIDLGYCLDLLDQQYLDFVAFAYARLSESREKLGKELPINKPFGLKDIDFKNRELDCAVIRYAHELAHADGSRFDSVRAAFWEGDELYPRAGFKTHNHIQIAVINPNCIKGVFLPREKQPFP
ncbi:hypothetical protein [Methylomagnum sp.]